LSNGWQKELGKLKIEESSKLKTFISIKMQDLREELYGLDREITRIRGCSTPVVDTPKQQQVDKGSQDSLSSPTSIGKFKG
jgi:hypothetical protein